MRQRKEFCYSNVTKLRISELYSEIILKKKNTNRTTPAICLSRCSFTCVESNGLEKRFAKGLAPQALLSSTAQGSPSVSFGNPVVLIPQDNAQGCAGKLALWEKRKKQARKRDRKLCFATCAHFYGVNPSTGANFKLPT